MNEKTITLDKTLGNIQCEKIDGNFKANAALKIELDDVKKKVNTNENKLVTLFDASNIKVFKVK